jgi:hypothetical protein
MENLANTKILTETGRAAKALSTVNETLVKTIASVSVFTQEVSTLVEQIDIKQGELSQLDAVYADKVRQHKIDLNFKIQENADAEFESMLSDKGLVAVKPDYISSLENTITTITTDKEKEIKAEGAKVSAKLTADHANEIKVKELTYEKEQAESKSKLAAALDKITYLETALKEANETLSAERAARIEIASKTAQPVINVNGK